MGAERALNVVALQKLLMSGVRNHSVCPGVAAQTHRFLATAASLDYVLLLCTDSAGTRIPPADAERAIHDGFARAVDDALLLLRALLPMRDLDARAFARDGLGCVRATIGAEGLADNERMFSLIVLAADLSV